MTLDYKVWIEGTQFICPAAITMFSIDGRIRSVKGRYLDSDISLFLEFDEQDEKLARVEGKKGGEKVDIRVRHTSLTYTHFMDLKSGNFFEAIYQTAQFTDRGNLELIRNVSKTLPREIGETLAFKFQYEGNRLSKRIDQLRDETINITYKKVFSESSIPYRTNQNKELHPNIEVDSETLTNYFLFLHQ